MSAPTPRVNSHLLSLHTGAHPNVSSSAINPIPLRPHYATTRRELCPLINARAGQQVALVGRVKDCSPEMARVEAADGADVTIKRQG